MSDDSIEEIEINSPIQLCAETPAKDSAGSFTNSEGIEKKILTSKIANSKGRSVQDPVHVLQLSQSFFSSDNIDDDDDDISLIPPTPSDVPFIVPSTPETKLNENSSIGEETVIEKYSGVKEVKESAEILDDDDDDDWMKPTQALFPNDASPQKKQDSPEKNNEIDDDETFADTAAILDSVYDMPTQRLTPTPESKPRTSSAGDVDESWNLKLTASQATEPLDSILLETLNKKQDSPIVTLDDEKKETSATEEFTKDSVDQKSKEKADTSIEEKEIIDISAEKSNIEEEDEKELANKTLTPPAPSRSSQSQREREATPEEISLFAEIESIVRASEASKQTSDSSTPVEVKKISNKSGTSQDSDSDEIAPSQTSNRSVNVSRKVTKSSKNKSKIIVPETEPFTIETKGENGIHRVENIAETECFIIDTDGDSKPTKRTNRLGRKTSAKAKLQEVQKLKESSGTSGKSSPDSNNDSSSHIVMHPPEKRSPPKRKSMDKKSDVSPKSMNNSVLSIDSLDFKFSTPGSSKQVFGTFSDRKSLENLISSSFGMPIEEEKLKIITSPRKSAYLKVDLGIHMYIYAEGNKICGEYQTHGKNFLPKVDISPANSSSTNASAKTSSFISLTSGEMGDISSSLSSKSISSSISSSIQTMSKRSQELNFKTSTQNSEIFSDQLKTKKGSPFVRLSDIDKKSSQDDFQDPVVVVSPMKKGSLDSSKKSESSAALVNAEKSKIKRKREGRKPSLKNLEVSSSDTDVETKRAKKVALPDDDTPVSTKKGTVKKSKKVQQTSMTSRVRRNILETENKGSNVKAKAVPLPLPVEEIEDSDSSSFSIIPGMRVMTRWKDTYYYPGMVLNQEVDGRWSVQFDDGATRIISEPNLLKVAILQEGTKVHAMSPDGYFDPGTISSHYREGNETGYVVELKSGVSRRYPRASVILSTEQAKKLMTTTNVLLPKVNIMLDNIVGGKRKRSSLNQNDAPPTTPTVITTRKTRKRNPDPNLDSTESSANESSLPKNIVSDIISIDTSEVDEKNATAHPLPAKKQKLAKGKKVTNQKMPKQPSAAKSSTPKQPNAAKSSTPKQPSATKSSASKQPSGSKPSTPKQPSVPKSSTPKQDNAAKTSTSKLSSTKKSLPKQPNAPKAGTVSSETTSNDNFTKVEVKSLIVKDVPVRSTKLFQDYAFLLTSTAKKQEDDGNLVSEFSFDKDHLCKLVTSGGGIVCETFEEAQKCSKKKIILLANSFLRTIKYLQCVAANIPCVQHYWVQNCHLTRKIVERGPYMLATGFSLIDNCIIQWHGTTDIFNGLKVVITAEKKSEFVNVWTPVLLAAKADLVQKWNMPSFLVPGTAFYVDFIITNETCPSNILTAAKNGGIPVVSSEYVIQCIIAGRKLPYDGHLKFKYDYKE